MTEDVDVDVDVANGNGDVVLFPPVLGDMLQVVNYDEHFNHALDNFLIDRGLSDFVFDYHVVSILGAQSSGKSTLLNLLFGTRFQTMDDAEGRYQVTQGIWAGIDKAHNNKIVFDLEGTDSRERGGEVAVNYERKIALFALVLSEILIINLWAQDIGRYNASNLDLLKTIMELNLQLFNPAKQTETQVENPDASVRNKTKLLFVMRDHVSSPIEKLKAILQDDMRKIWTTVTANNNPDLAFEDLFIIDFYSLPHKLLMEAEFKSRAEELRRMFSDEDIFEHDFHNDISSDGFSNYADSVWTTIRDNKELDIPSQKEMLAHVRCEQIGDEAVITFKTATVNCTSVSEIRPALADAMAVYETSAKRYNPRVANAKRSDMLDKITTHVTTAILDEQVAKAAHSILVDAQGRMSMRVTAAVKQERDAWTGWAGEKAAIKADSDAQFDAKLIGNQNVGAEEEGGGEMSQVIKEVLAFVEAEREKLGKRIEEVIERNDVQIVDKVKSYLIDSFATRIQSPVATCIENAKPDNTDTITSATTTSSSSSSLPIATAASVSSAQPQQQASMWAAVSGIVGREWEVTEQDIKEIWCEDGLGKKGLEKVMKELQLACSNRAIQVVRQVVGSAGSIMLRINKQFNDSFRFDSRGIPRHFGPGDDVESIFIEARDQALATIDLLSILDVDVSLCQRNGSRKMLAKTKMVVLDLEKRREMKEQLTRQAGVVFMEAKRSAEAARITSKVPIWLLGVLVVLGWNEFMAVLSSPILLFMVVLIAPVAYLGYMVDAPTLLGPAVGATVQPYVERAKEMVHQMTQPAQPQTHDDNITTTTPPLEPLNASSSATSTRSMGDI